MSIVGRLRNGGAVHVSLSVATKREKAGFVYPEGPVLPRLSAILSKLEKAGSQDGEPSGAQEQQRMKSRLRRLTARALRLRRERAGYASAKLSIHAAFDPPCIPGAVACALHRGG